MSENFFQRWARRKSETGAGPSAAPPVNPEAEEASGQTEREGTHPSLHELAQLAPDADYSAFLAPGVDRAVRRAALKKLFSDPHFNRMDGLDVYIEDYTRPEPLTAAMRAALAHARGLVEEPDSAARRSPGCLADVADVGDVGDQETEKPHTSPRPLPASFDASPVIPDEAAGIAPRTPTPKSS